MITGFAPRFPFSSEEILTRQTPEYVSGYRLCFQMNYLAYWIPQPIRELGFPLGNESVVPMLTGKLDLALEVQCDLRATRFTL